MLSSLLPGVLSAVLLHAGSQTVTQSPPAATGQATPRIHTDASGFALTLPNGTLCFGQPRGVRCDRRWPSEPPPTVPVAADVKPRPSWHFTLFDRTICLGDAPKDVRCNVRLAPPDGQKSSA